MTDIKKIKSLIVENLMNHYKMSEAEALEYISSGNVEAVESNLYTHTYPAEAGVMRRDVYKENKNGLRQILALTKNNVSNEEEWSEFKG